MGDQSAVEFIRVQAALAGRYSLRRELGRGGMGIVYLAHDVALERPVALKVLQPQLANQQVLKQRFQNEARTAAKLSHPNIIPIFAVDEVDDVVFFVMAFVDGETLGQRIRSRGPLAASELAKILRDVGWALTYAHSQGVVHRDVKVDNIMIERATGRALMVDFGIALISQHADETDALEMLGTADYMSPEQASGDGADSRSDIYSLGVVAYYALSGRLPFEGTTAGEVLVKQITQVPRPIAEHVPGISARMANAIDRCLAKDPALRFANAEDLADAVDVAVVSRREVPPAIRNFVTSSSELTHNIIWISYFQLFFAVLAGLDALTPAALARDVWLAIAAIALVVEPIPVVGMLSQIRKFLKSGYTREDLVDAWKRALPADQPDGLLEHARVPGSIERASRVAVPLGWAVMIGSAAVGGFSSGNAGLALGSVGLMSAFIGGVVSLWRHDDRTELSRRLAGALLQSRVGRWAFKLAGVGLDRSSLASLGTHRPTELALGMAVDSLFDALPKTTRLILSELPSVVKRLQADAMKMRQRVEQLNDVVTQTDIRVHSTSHPLAENHALAQRRDSLDRELSMARDAAKDRVADAVTALETIRLDLLRLTAGAGTLENLTTDLADARAVSEELGRLLAARNEVEAHLSRSRAA